MRFLLNLIQLCFNLPWWGVLAVLGGVAVFGWYGLAWYVGRQFDQIVKETVLSIGSALKDAQVTIHSVTAAPQPTGPSPYDLPEDDENFMEELDGTPWGEEGMNFYSIEATIAPADAGAAWDPTALTLVPADFVPEDPTCICEHMGGLHSAEIFVNGRFRPAREEDVAGPQRLRMLFGIGDDIRTVKFCSGVQYFGHIALPAPLAKSPKLARQC